MDMPCLRKWFIRTNLQIETHLFARHQNVTLQVLKLYMSLHFFLLVHIFLGCKFNCTFLNYLGKLFGITRERWSMILLRLIGDLFKLSGLNNVTFNFYVPGWKSWSVDPVDGSVGEPMWGFFPVCLRWMDWKTSDSEYEIQLEPVWCFSWWSKFRSQK